MKAKSVRVGRLKFFWWAGSWTWIEIIDCLHCRNVFVGPIGFEWLTPKREVDVEQ